MMTTPASFDFNRRVLLSTLALLPALIGPLRPKSAVAQTDTLQSWSDGPAKTSIINFVARVTTQGGPDFVPAEQRIAVFDNDGTLWCEQPMYVQLAFILDRVKAMAPLHPEWKDKQPFKAVLEDDMKTLSESGERGMRDGRPTLFRLPEVNFIDDKGGKPVGINEHIGRRAIAAFGNSDGDLEMLQWATLSGGVRLGLIVHHTDAEREYAYDRQSHFGKLDTALDAAALNKWTVVDMKSDWKRVFAFE